MAFDPGIGRRTMSAGWITVDDEHAADGQFAFWIEEAVSRAQS
jgi:hypothetical protein